MRLLTMNSVSLLMFLIGCCLLWLTIASIGRIRAYNRFFLLVNERDPGFRFNQFFYWLGVNDLS